MIISAPHFFSVVVGTPHSQNVVTQMMDIAEPLNTLRTLLSHRLDCYLNDHEIHLQDSTVVRTTTAKDSSRNVSFQHKETLIAAQKIRCRITLLSMIIKRSDVGNSIVAMKPVVSLAQSISE